MGFSLQIFHDTLGAAAIREISLACQQTMQARIRVRDRHGSCPKQTVIIIDTWP